MEDSVGFGWSDRDLNWIDSVTNDDSVAALDFQQLFEAAPGAYLVLAADAPRFTIVAVSDAYLRATRTQRHQLLGQPLFEAFPANPDDLTPDKGQNLRRSLETVIASRRADAMAVQKYDIPRLDSEGGFEERYWKPLNSPILNAAGEVTQILNSVEDVTEFVKLRQQQTAQRQENQVLKLRTNQMEAEIDSQSQALSVVNVQLEAVVTRLEHILSSIQDGFYVLNADWRYTYINDRQLEMIDMRRADVIGRSVWDLFPEVVNSVAYDQLQRVAIDRSPVRFEFLHPIWNRWFEHHAYPFDGGISVVCTEITDRKQAELARRQTEERFEQLATSLPHVFWLSEPAQQRLIYASPAYESVWGRPLAELYENFEAWIAAIHPDDRDFLTQHYCANILSGNYNVEYRIVRPDGEIRWIHDRGSPVTQAEGVQRVAGFAEDITVAKHLEASRKQAEQERDRFFELSLDLLAIADFNGYFTRINPAWQTILGWSEAELMAVPFLELIHPDDREHTIAIAEQMMQGIPATQIENRYRCKDGTYRWLLWNAIAIPEQQLTYAVAHDITNRKTADAALHESEARFRAYAENSKDVIWITAAQDYRLIYLSPSYETVWGRSIADLFIDLTQFLNTIHPDDRDRVAAGWQRCAQALYTQEYRIVRPNGEIRWIYDRGFPVYNDAGEMIYVGGVAQDVTVAKHLEEGRKAAESALQEAYVQLEAALMAGSVYTWRWRILEDRVTVNAAFADLFGVDPVEARLGLPIELFINAMHEEDRAHVTAAINRAIETGEFYSAEYRVYTADGDERWVTARGRVEYDHAGRAIALPGALADITDRIRAEQERDRFFRLSQDMLAIISTDGYFLQLNPAWIRTLDYTIEELTAQPYIEFVHPDDRAATEAEAQKIVATGVPIVAFENRYRHRDGSYRWIAWSVAPFLEQKLLYCVARDVTDSKRTAAALEQSEARYRYLAESIPQLVWTADATGKLTDVNQRWQDYTGLSIEQAAEAGWQAIVHPDDMQTLSDRWAAAQQTGTPYQAEGRLRRADGSYRWHLHQAIPQKSDRGKIAKWFGTATDIHDRIQLEAERERLLEREQAAREQAETANRIKDEFLAVLSHELRSPLNPILGWTRLLRTRKFDAQATDRALETIERNAKLQTQLIEDLLDVSRILRGKMVLNVQPVNLAGTIEAAIETVRLAADAKQIQIHTQLDRSIGRVAGEASRLQQVVWNLLTNAVKFTSSGGQVEVRLEAIGNRELGIGNRQDNPTPNSQLPTPQAQLTVADTGKGITPDFLPYVFEYFRQEDSKTTRKFGGLGLGLAIVRHITELHGGTVSVNSAGEGKGATFTVRLPLMQEGDRFKESHLPSLPQIDEAAPLTGVRILVVDDELDMRDLVVTILEPSGASVQVADCAAAALQAIQSTAFDLLICDIGMPDVDGYMLIREIRLQGRQIPAIALTAFAAEADRNAALAAGYQLHIGKPIDPTELVKKITMLIERSPQV